MLTLKTIGLIINIFVLYTNGQLLQSVLQFLRQGETNRQYENRSGGYGISEFDFIIVGAGTAGCVLANRLTENPDWKVLLIEAGQSENLLMDIPLVVQYLQANRDVNWGYRPQSSNVSCLAMVDNRCLWPRGKVMGGSSVLNYMIYTRGNRKDYDNWEAMGNPGWGYDDVLPYFKKLENSRIKNASPDYAGKGGPLTVSEVDWKSDVAKAFVAAGLEMGWPYVDYNGPSQIGVSYLQTSTKDGRRDSSNVAYLYPIQRRKNLFIRKLSQVTKILIDPKTKTATGVQYMCNGKFRTVLARREVIVSAGAINSPQLLMLSGIGPADHLKEMNIKTIMDLPVGFNLMDHAAPGALTFTTNASTLSLYKISPYDFIKFTAGNRKSILESAGGCESLAFLELDDPSPTINPDGYPDIELLQTNGGMHSLDIFPRIFGLKPSIYDAMFRQMEIGHMDGFMIYPMVLRPKSRGRIKLKSKHPLVYPLIYSGYLTHPYDVDISVKGIKKIIEMMDTAAFKKIDAKLYKVPIPTCSHLTFGSDLYWECHTRHFTFTIYHYSGTCKMGAQSDPTAVVDPRLKVKGIKNLRVVDASIFPEIMAGHPNSPVYMIAEKAADMIKGDQLNAV